MDFDRLSWMLSFVTMPWLVWCHERNQWWAPGQSGYVSNIYEAGVYSFLDALNICNRSNTHSDKIQESMIPMCFCFGLGRMQEANND